MASRLQFQELFPDEIDSPKKLRVLTNVWKYSVSVDFISHKNINQRAHLNQDRLHSNRKVEYMMGNTFSSFINNFYF